MKIKLPVVYTDDLLNIHMEKNLKPDCLLQGQAQLDQRIIFSFFHAKVKETIRNNPPMYQVTMVTLGPVGLMKSSRKQKLFKDWVGQ